MLTRIHVNQHIIRANLKTGANDPPITVIRNGKTMRAHEIIIQGESRVVHSPAKPLSCGARVWIETTAPVIVKKVIDKSE